MDEGPPDPTISVERAPLSALTGIAVRNHRNPQAKPAGYTGWPKDSMQTGKDFVGLARLDEP
jgi:hypothetical protein